MTKKYAVCDNVPESSQSNIDPNNMDLDQFRVYTIERLLAQIKIINKLTEIITNLQNTVKDMQEQIKTLQKDGK